MNERLKHRETGETRDKILRKKTCKWNNSHVVRSGGENHHSEAPIPLLTPTVTAGEANDILNRQINHQNPFLISPVIPDQHEMT